MRPRDENKVIQLKQKAIEMIVSDGIEAFGVNKLAKAAGVAPGTIYIYFKDKEDLLLTLCEEVSHRILETSLKGLEPDMSFEKGMKLQWKNRYLFSRKYPEEVAFIEKVRYTSVYESMEEKLTARYGKLLLAFLQKAVADKQLAEMPFEMYWSLAFAPLYQLISFSRQHPQRKRKFTLTDDVLQNALAHVLKGMRP
ncbi:TetR/AcrR family transcriptional regulator [Chitinophaga sp. G-6-1-13]|uniref:TetR/AcrR family transcriptional regulator n=1 Tax=Chitinophaga fulva TaxID=2728842 RepID=A0A848GX08_9BACT|nr:TetR/AcrR family transcriptional regulator [Chitinophaga fulva]NML41849.1 TetR/AcrR family transcriptional regulator [Chitinophaga fulva]